MIIRIQKTETLRDCSMWYKLEFDREYTVSELINETKILDNYANYYILVRKWAETKVAESIYGKVRYLYNCGKKVISAESNGGYGLMNYYLTIAGI